LKLPVVYAVDEIEREGTPDYFPYEAMTKFAAAHGQQAVLDSASAWMEGRLHVLTAAMPNLTVGQILLHVNDPSQASEGVGQQPHVMYPLLAVGSGTDLPDAELKGRWYTRESKILA